MENQEFTYPWREQQPHNLVIWKSTSSPVWMPTMPSAIRTIGHTILMGRKTFESLPHGALPNRRNIVVSHQNIQLENCEVFPSIKQALDACQDDVVFVIGGSSIYEQTLQLADKIYLTQVESASAYADTFFPEFHKEEWDECRECSINILTSNTKETLSCTFYIYKKKSKQNEINL